jgi:hypothetical protein
MHVFLIFVSFTPGKQLYFLDQWDDQGHTIVDYSSFSYYVHIVVDLVSFLFTLSVTIFYMDARRGNQLL